MTQQQVPRIMAVIGLSEREAAVVAVYGVVEI